jgi:2-methylcitrate dehydratase PrpD
VSDPRYAAALADWLACAAQGREERAARASRSLGDPVAAAATAGHVLDFDDTYAPGLAHLSAPTAPAALVVGAELSASAGEALAAYAAGFEAMGALARAGHPALYDRGFHPTAACGALGAAVAAGRLLGLEGELAGSARALALLEVTGLRAVFGSDGKALQVGAAAAAGARAAKLAAAGARVPLEAAARGFAEVSGAVYAEPDPASPAIAENWIKPWPCCLQTHAPIEAALHARAAGAAPARVLVHPVSLQAAAVGPAPADGLEAKFSIGYLVAFALLYGPPAVESFRSVDAEARRLARRIEVRSQRALLESEAVLLDAGGAEIARVEAAPGSPLRPLGEDAVRTKLGALAGALDDRERPARELLTLAGLPVPGEAPRAPRRAGGSGAG